MKPAIDPSDLRATDVLANERTFLAYERTALAFVGFGFVLARFSVFTREAAIVAHLSLPSPGLSTALGIAMIVAGVLCALYGGYRYVASARALRAGTISPLSDRAAMIGALTIAVVGLIVSLELALNR